MQNVTPSELLTGEQRRRVYDNRIDGDSREDRLPLEGRLAQQIVVTALQGHLQLVPSEEAISQIQRCFLGLVSISSRSDKDRDTQGLIEAAIDETIRQADELRKTIRMPDIDV